jgi:hypothetical protein
MAEPKPTETLRARLRDLMTEFECEALSGGASPGVSDLVAPKTPEPTLADLLAACDLAEEAGVPPAVVEILRRIVTVSAGVPPGAHGRITRGTDSSTPLPWYSARTHPDTSIGNTSLRHHPTIVMGADGLIVADCRVEGRSGEECRDNAGRIVTDSWAGSAIEAQMDTLRAAFNPGGACDGLLQQGQSLIAHGIPVLIAEVTKMREARRAADRALHHDPTHPYDQIRLAYDTEDSQRESIV